MQTAASTAGRPCIATLQPAPALPGRLWRGTTHSPGLNRNSTPHLRTVVDVRNGRFPCHRRAHRYDRCCQLTVRLYHRLPRYSNRAEPEPRFSSRNRNPSTTKLSPPAAELSSGAPGSHRSRYGMGLPGWWTRGCRGSLPWYLEVAPVVRFARGRKGPCKARSVAGRDLPPTRRRRSGHEVFQTSRAVRRA